ncbi:hypothetical protein F5Y04DRAFT_276949 [Hypomontagnella monticulosa]|nr:hypothetical protein F5Y04DRAFT_276949 [Hypomontagnella monticulosa]
MSFHKIRSMDHDIEAGREANAMSQPLPEILRTSEDDILLREQIQQIDGDKVQRIAILSFRALQLSRIAKLQAELVRKQNAMMNPSKGVHEEKPGPAEDPEEERRVDELLQRYADAVRNYETLSQTIEFDKDIVYEFLGGRQEFKVMKRTNDVDWNVPWWIQRRGALSTVPRYHIGPLGFRELDKGRLSQRWLLERVKSRLLMAVFGGMAVIAPVMIMTLKPSIIGDLVTTLVSTMIFAIAMVILATDASGKDVLASTAAYAAIMVVFLGTSLQVYL